MKNPKTPKPNTPPKPSRAFVFQDYLQATQIRKSKELKERLEKLADKLVEWALTCDDAIILREFYVENGLNPMLAMKNKKFKKAHELAKLAIGVRREKGTMLKRFSESTLRSLPLYSPSWTEGEDWKKLEEWRSNLRKSADEQKGDTIIKVEMPSYLEKDKKDETKSR